MQPGPLGHFRMEPWDVDGYSYGLSSYGMLWIWDRLMGYMGYGYSYMMLYGYRSIPMNIPFLGE